MSGWLNFNESINTIKGQITNFATNVLADDEEHEASESSKEDFQKLCIQKDLEIEHLKKINEELRKKSAISEQRNGEPNDNNWDWTTPEFIAEEKSAQDDIANLKNIIKHLENEKNHLRDQLEQLDLENQQNLTGLVQIRENLQDVNSELKDKIAQLLQQNKSLLLKQEKLNKKIATLETKASTEPNDPPENDGDLLKTNQDLQEKFEVALKELVVLKSTHDTLETTLENTKKSSEKELSDLIQKLRKSELDSKTIYTELQEAKQLVDIAEVKRREDADNCQKLAFILESYEKQVTSLKSELASLKNTKDPDLAFFLQTNLDKALQTVADLENQNARLIIDVELNQSESKQKLEQLKHQLDEKTKEILSLKARMNQYAQETDQITHLEKEKKSLREDFDNECELIHVIYVNTIKNNIRKYLDPSLIPCEPSGGLIDDPYMTEFIEHVENIFKILIEFKRKCEGLEKDLMEASNEKTNILNEKYTEIEKLIQNSEMLSEEVIKKGETVKELESEVAQLIESNDLLLSELDSYKTTNLQTISESNEDSMILLETSLENANKKIEELENIINSCKNIDKVSVTSNHQLDKKITEKQDDYQELLSGFDELKIDYDEVADKLTKANKKMYLLEADNEELKSALEKLKTEFENTDYQLSEANFALESLKEELDATESKAEKLHQEISEQKSYNKNNIDAKEQLNEVKEKWIIEENKRRELEGQVKTLTEKIQHSKVTEMSLKLQYDTLQKEHNEDVDAKNNLEQSLASAKSSITEYENNYTELLQKYDGILLRCEELNTALHEKDIEIMSVKSLEEQNKRLEQLARDNCAKLNKETEEKDIQIANGLAKVSELELEIAALKRLTVDQKREIDDFVCKSNVLRDLVDETKAHLIAKDDQLIEFKNRYERAEQHNTKLEADLALAAINITSEVEQVSEEHSLEPKDVLYDEEETLQGKIVSLQTALAQSQDNNDVLQKQLLELGDARNELINMVTIKHQESLNYHNEIQRLTQILTSETDKFRQLEAKLLQAGEASNEISKKSEEIDSLLDQNNFLKEKCDVLTKNLLEEQSKLQQLLAEKSTPTDKEISLLKQLESLQSYLMEQEERYTQELLQSEEKNSQLRIKLTDLEQHQKNSSTMYTSVSIRANQQVETLQVQLQMVTNQRDDLRKKISDLEDFNNKQAAALANLQFVLEQFQKDKEKDVLKETERIRRQINSEKQVQDDLRLEINSLKSQLEESKIGLQAASRLSDQLELLKKQNSGLKDEVSELQKNLSKSHQAIQDLTSQTDGKIDKSLIKSLLVGFLSSGNSSNWNKDQAQVLKLIASVLDFNQQDHEKVKLYKPQQVSWIGSILSPQSNNSNISTESLSQAFVRFLENESKPRVVPSLLGEESNRAPTSNESSKRNTPSASPPPIVLNEVVLPTFADFGQSRNSSSILKDVLKDNNR